MGRGGAAKTHQAILDEGDIEVCIAPDFSGTAYYVSPPPAGNDGNTGLSWSTAFATIDYAVSQCTPGAGDVVYVAVGTYDETANAANGVECDVANVSIVGIGSGVIVTNTDTTNGGSVFLVTAANVDVTNITAVKGEIASTGSIGYKFDTGASGCNIIDGGAFIQNAATHIGIQFTGGVVQCSVKGTVPFFSGAVGQNGVGIGIDFDDCTQCTAANAVFAGLGTGTLYGASSLLSGTDPTTIIFDCVIGTQLNAGATDSILGASSTNNTTDIIDNSGNATNSTWSSFSALREDVSHIQQFAGTIYVVDGTNGKDTNDGRSPLTAFETIGQALSVMGNGDAVSIRAGTYDENGLDMSSAGQVMLCETGVIITDSTPGTCLVISGDACLVKNAHFVQAGAVGLQITGIGTTVQDCVSVTCTTGFDIDEHSTQMFNCVAAACTVTAFDIGERNTILRECFAPGTGAATRGFYLSSSVVTRSLLDQCHSVGNATSGFTAVSGTINNTISFSTSGGGDGPTVRGTLNNWAGYIDQLDTEHHEDIYPVSAGQGVAGDPINVANATTDGVGGQRQDQNYWGDVVRIIPPDILTAQWMSVGIYIHANTAADIQQWGIFFTYADKVSAQNGGNDWDENETVLTVADGSLFEDGDFIWIAGDDRVEGEILKVSGAPAGNVVTIARETTADAEAGLRYDYDVAPGNNKMYLVKRPGVALYDGFDGDYAASGSRDHARYDWHQSKQLASNAGMLIRMLNATDNGASSFDARAIYED